MNPKISKLKAERAKNDGKIAMLQSATVRSTRISLSWKMRISSALPVPPA